MYVFGSKAVSRPVRTCKLQAACKVSQVCLSRLQAPSKQIADVETCRLPWARTGLAGWGVALSVGPLLGSAFVGLIWCFMASRYRSANEQQAAELQSVVDDKTSSYGQVVQPMGPVQSFAMSGQPGAMMPTAIQQGSNQPRF
jgi:hypothetical protein